MKPLRLIGAGCLAILLLAGMAHAVKPGKTMSVQMHKGELRAAPSRLAAVVSTVKYGDRLTVQESQSGWIKASAPDGASGWIHESALTPKRIVLASGTGDAQLAASSDEMAMAGKGFNSDVEKQFKDKNKDIDFTWVDKMETFLVPPTQLQQFMKDGRVDPSKGGAR